jgi:hypothetical protein
MGLDYSGTKIIQIFMLPTDSVILDHVVSLLVANIMLFEVASNVGFALVLLLDFLRLAVRKPK